jgi:hypothetical protein
MRCPNVRLSKNASLHISNQKKKRAGLREGRENSAKNKRRGNVYGKRQKNGFCVQKVYVKILGKIIFWDAP